VVAPARDEAGNLRPLISEIAAALDDTGLRYQVLVIDDGSRDATAAELRGLSRACRDLTVIRFEAGRGQSAALRAGIHAASARRIATIDADRQNDPADLPPMLARLDAAGLDLVQGDRSANRQDHRWRRIASGVARLVRRWVLHDQTRDTGCTLRVMRADLARRLPLHRPGMHRFVPALARGLGARVLEVPVHHRPRTCGRTKYGTGLIQRGLPGLRDCFVVRRILRSGRRREDHPPVPAAARPGVA
jgi:glycosyltransferase involved in cell wall biosynthesis